MAKTVETEFIPNKFPTVRGARALISDQYDDQCLIPGNTLFGCFF